MKYVGYYRVSTKKQGQSGLGLEGQEATVNQYVRQHDGTLLATYTEVESGRKDDRPQLTKALAHARRSNATLVVAKLDRLSRSVRVLSTLLESGVKFVACDNPNANHLTIHILAAVAEQEAKAISERTKSALQAYKARGGKLGSHLEQCRTLTNEIRQKGLARSNEVVKRKADEAYADLVDTLKEWRLTMTLKQIANRLNDDGHTTRRGKMWGEVQVMRVLNRFG